MTLYDQSGNLILPKGTIEEYRLLHHNPRNARCHTGVYVTCPRCGRTWERMVKHAGRLKCKGCSLQIEVEEI